MCKKLRSFTIDDKSFQFDTNAFRMLFDERKGENKVADYELELGKAFSVSRDAIHSWRFGKSGPTDLDLIRKISEHFGLSDFYILLKKEDNVMVQVSERQKDSLKRVYDAIIDYLDKFYRTDGFNDYWHSLCEKGVNPRLVEDELYSIAQRCQHMVELTLEKESIVISNLDVFEKLQEYVYDDLCETYNGKLSYAYRFEAPVENLDGTQSGVTTVEDYTKALKRANELIAPYMQ